MEHRTLITERCADFIKDLKYEDLDEKTVGFAKKCIIDWLGCIMGGSSFEAGNIIEQFVDEMGGKEAATAFGSFKKTSPINASLANGYNCHILEMDDVHKKSIIHPGAPVISAAFSIAEAFGCDGKELITAIAAGYDIAIRVGEAVMPSHYLIWHATGTCGTFGAAAAAAKLLGLNKKQILYALGNAGTQAAGLWEFLEDNAMSKYLHCGKAAMNGVIAALLARKDFSGATSILEGKRGFFRAYSRELNWEESFAGLGHFYKINETVFKPYASCRHTHPSVDGVLKLRQEHELKHSDVEKIIIQTYDNVLNIAGNKHFNDARTAKFSLVYCVAAALKFGKLGLGEFEKEKLADPDIDRLAKMVEVDTPEEINRQHPEKWMSIVTIQTKTGQYSTTIDFPKGDPENTLSDQELDNKFFELADVKIPHDKAEKILKKCKQIEGITNLAEFTHGLV